MLAGLSASAQFAQFPDNISCFLAGNNTWRIPSLVSNTTMSGSLVRTVATLAPSAATNFGIDFSASPAGFIQATNHVAITGLTNNAAGAAYQLLIVNSSGSDLNITAPSTAYKSGYAAVADFPVVLTNGTAAFVDIFGYGTASSNALYRFTRFVK
jgi:hypothetical protein